MNPDGYPLMQIRSKMGDGPVWSNNILEFVELSLAVTVKPVYGANYVRTLRSTDESQLTRDTRVPIKHLLCKFETF